MGFEIKVEIKDEVTKKLNELTSKINDIKPLLNQIGYTLIEQVEENFENESFFGEKWTPLTTTTKRQKEKKGYKKILQNRGTLAESIDFTIQNNKLILGTNIKYAPIHQFGGVAGKSHTAKIPARPFLPIKPNTQELPKETENEILEVIKSFFEYNR